MRTGAAALMLCGALMATSLAGCVHDEPLPGELRLPVAFGLSRDDEGLQQSGLDINTPDSSTFHQWLTAAQIADRFGAPELLAESALATAEAAGFDGVIDPTRGYLIGTMSVADVEELLGVTMVVETVAAGDIVRPSRLPSVPAALRGSVLDVVGLTALLPMDRGKGTSPADPSASSMATGLPRAHGCPGRTGTADMLRAQYGLNPAGGFGPGAAAGGGVSLALIEIAVDSNGAIKAFSECYGYPVPPLTSVEVGPIGPPEHDSQEVTLDVAAAALVAPKLNEITLYSFNPFTSVFFPLADTVTDTYGSPTRTIVSTSIGLCEDDITEPTLRNSEWVLAAAAATGATVVAASGDDGSSGCHPQTDQQRAQYPAASPFVTAVGGTQLAQSSLLTRLLVEPRAVTEPGSQVVWNQSPEVMAASGGATSSLVARPGYQQALGPPDGRSVPDVSYLAAASVYGRIPVCIEGEGCTYTAVGGTSATAPGFAAALATVASTTSAAGGVRRLGLLNPQLYALGRSGHGGVFVDVTEGNNDLYGVGCCDAAPGFDTATGWGALNVGAFARG